MSAEAPTRRLAFSKRFSESFLLLLMILIPIIVGFGGYVYFTGLPIGIRLLRPDDLPITEAGLSPPAVQLAARSVWEIAATVQEALCILAIFVGVFILFEALRTDSIAFRVKTIAVVLCISFAPLVLVWSNTTALEPIYVNQRLIFQKTLGSLRAYQDEVAQSYPGESQASLREKYLMKIGHVERAQKQVQGIRSAIHSAETSIPTSNAEIARIRENLKLLKPGEPLYARYIGMIANEETEIGKSRAEIKKLSAALNQAERALSAVADDPDLRYIRDKNTGRMLHWAILFDWLSFCMAIYFAFVSSLLFVRPRQDYLSKIREAEAGGYVNLIQSNAEKAVAFYGSQLQLLRYVLYTGTFVLIFSLFYQSAMLNWAVSGLSSDNKELLDQVKGLTNSYVTTRALISTLILAFVYLPSALALQGFIASLSAKAEANPQKREEWLQSHGFASSSPLEFLPRLAAILGPLLTVPLNELLRGLLTLNS